jgi:RNA polymerase sigma-70 factor (ECF subfamily)
LIIARHAASLVLYARQWCHLPDDAVQEALCELVSLNDVPPEPVAWLFRVVRYRALNLARSERRRDLHHRACQQHRDAWFSSDASSATDAADVQLLLTQLPELEREIIVARVWGGLTFEQISELTHTPTSSVHRFYQRAMTKLRDFLESPLESKS